MRAPTRADREAPAQAMNIAFYVLAQMLEDAGVIDQDRLAEEIGRFDPQGKEALRANLAGLQGTLRNRPFGAKAPRLMLVPGGSDGADSDAAGG